MPYSWPYPETLAAELGPALAAAARACSICPERFGCATRPNGSAGIRTRPRSWSSVAYGLTERRRSELADARLVACAGCYPTAAVLALQPLVADGLLEPGIIIDAKSGISGAGKTPSERTHFSECHDSISAYGVFAHRHAAEIEQELGVPVTFVPHLVPLDRGIFETIYARLRPGVDAAAVEAALTRAYAGSPFVRLTGADLPEIKHVAHTNFCDIGWRVKDTQLVMVVVHRQPGQGSGRPGDSELQRRLRLRRDDGAQLEFGQRNRRTGAREFFCLLFFCFCFWFSLFFSLSPVLLFFDVGIGTY